MLAHFALGLILCWWWCDLFKVFLLLQHIVSVHFESWWCLLRACTSRCNPHNPNILALHERAEDEHSQKVPTNQSLVWVQSIIHPTLHKSLAFFLSFEPSVTQIRVPLLIPVASHVVSFWVGWWVSMSDHIHVPPHKKRKSQKLEYMDSLTSSGGSSWNFWTVSFLRSLTNVGAPYGGGGLFSMCIGVYIVVNLVSCLMVCSSGLTCLSCGTMNRTGRCSTTAIFVVLDVSISPVVWQVCALFLLAVPKTFLSLPVHWRWLFLWEFIVQSPLTAVAWMCGEVLQVWSVGCSNVRQKDCF